MLQKQDVNTDEYWRTEGNIFKQRKSRVFSSSKTSGYQEREKQTVQSHILINPFLKIEYTAQSQKTLEKKKGYRLQSKLNLFKQGIVCPLKTLWFISGPYTIKDQIYI